MGFFDLASPALSAIDGVFAGAPVPLRLLIWATVTGVISMLLYWLFSNQDKTAAAKERAVTARKKMASYEGHEFDEMMPLAKESLVASLKHTGIVLGPALLSSLPALMLIVWVSGEFGYRLPAPGDTVALAAAPADSIVLTATEWPHEGQTIDITAVDGTSLVTLPLAAPIPVVHKQVWWNSLIGNPNGYLAEDSPADEIYFELEPIEILGFGPGWARSWELTYFVVLILVSLGIKVAFRIH